MEAVMLVVYICGLILAFAISSKRRIERDALKARLEALQKKSQLEQDIELATTDQLMSEIAKRVPGFILLMPRATNSINEQHMSIHIKGIHPNDAIQCMGMAAHIMSTQPPTHQEETE